MELSAHCSKSAEYEDRGEQSRCRPAWTGWACRDLRSGEPAFFPTMSAFQFARLRLRIMSLSASAARYKSPLRCACASFRLDLCRPLSPLSPPRFRSIGISTEATGTSQKCARPPAEAGRRSGTRRPRRRRCSTAASFGRSSARGRYCERTGRRYTPHSSSSNTSPALPREEGAEGVCCRGSV